MADTSPYDDRFMRLVQEMRSSKFIEVHDGSWTDAFTEGSRDTGTSTAFDAALRHCSLGLGSVSCYWESYWDGVEGQWELNGEFLFSSFDAAIRRPPFPALIDTSQSDLEEEFYAKFHVIDETPHLGGGDLAGLRMTEGVTNPEVWFSPGLRPPLKMDVDYCGYADALLLTRGAGGWQYLYTDVVLEGPWYQDTADRLQGMLRAFSVMFPDTDYSALVARLEERV